MSPLAPRDLLAGGPVRRTLAGLIRSADVVQIHGIWEPHCFAAGRLAASARIPFIVSAHGMLDAWALRNKRWKKWAYSVLFERPNLNRAACLRALTPSEAEDYRAFQLRPPVVVIPNGIAVTPAGPEEFLSRYPQLSGRDLVLFLSRIHYKKGIHMLCRAWARVQPRFPRAHLVVAGPDYENTLSSVRDLVAGLGLTDSVTFTGMLHSALKWSVLAAASVFVLPSYSEGFSIAILEAMAAGLPVIATDACCFPEIEPYGCGMLIPPAESEVESALIALLGCSAGERNAMGDRGRSLARTRYTWERIGSEMADVYDWVLGGAQPAALSLASMEAD